MDTIKVKPWGSNQGDHVVINAEDFDPQRHIKFDEQPAAQNQPQKDKKNPIRGR